MANSDAASKALAVVGIGAMFLMLLSWSLMITAFLALEPSAATTNVMVALFASGALAGAVTTVCICTDTERKREEKCLDSQNCG